MQTSGGDFSPALDNNSGAGACDVKAHDLRHVLFSSFSHSPHHSLPSHHPDRISLQLLLLSTAPPDNASSVLRWINTPDGCETLIISAVHVRCSCTATSSIISETIVSLNSIPNKSTYQNESLSFPVHDYSRYLSLTACAVSVEFLSPFQRLIANFTAASKILGDINSEVRRDPSATIDLLVRHLQCSISKKSILELQMTGSPKKHCIFTRKRSRRSSTSLPDYGDIESNLIIVYVFRLNEHFCNYAMALMYGDVFHHFIVHDNVDCR